jgi:ribA/ribD-fused uncharacterized protein
MTIESQQVGPRQNAREICKNMGLDRVNQPGPEDPIFFYPKEFAVFDNFSSFQIEYDGYIWPTAEHAYQAARFKGVAPEVVEEIKKARSAHDAQKIARANKSKQIKNWPELMKDIMKTILRCKIDQHEYVHRKLLESGEREIIEDSWRDAEWGWGQNKDGKNLLGKTWMELRTEYKNRVSS